MFKLYKHSYMYYIILLKLCICADGGTRPSRLRRSRGGNPHGLRYPAVLRDVYTKFMCRRWDSNPHGLLH